MGQYLNPPRTCPGFKKKISYPSQTRLINLNSVPLGAGRVPEKTRPVAIPTLSDVPLMNMSSN